MKQMHLMALLMHTPINHMMMSWADPQDKRVEQLGSLQAWQAFAQKLEQGFFDGMFFADIPTAHDNYHDRTDEAVRYGVCWPAHDPVALVGAMAAATSHIGFATTVSVSALHPYQLVRTISTLDYLTGGRVGWNVVTGHSRSEHRAFGLPQMDHDERYARAQEFLEICYALWDGIPPEAILVDKENGVFADPERIRKVRFDGKYLKCHATPAVLPSPQGRPVIFQAGSSGPGLRFAADHADVVFSLQREFPAMINVIDQLKSAAIERGRTRPVNVAFGFQIVVGSTEGEAEQRSRRLIGKIPVEAALARASGTLGIDLGQVDIDKPMQEMDTQASRGTMAAIAKMFGKSNKTIRQVIAESGQAIGFPQLIGTPEQLADKLESMWRKSQCHGFILSPAISHWDLEVFVDEVVPLLQRRGIYRQAYEANSLRGNLLN
jgi:FMN-dependent oxidoreductase (nitrilotriacetate monooxygenase family)